MKVNNPNSKNILVAVSGGVDSMSLLHYLLYKKEYNLGVIHINHLTRGLENDKEYQLVNDFCITHQIPLYYFEYKYDNTKNFHQKARNFRIAMYEKISQEYKYDVVCLAHHLDDQIENILMNPDKIGLKLMENEKKINEIVINRPFLNVYKREIYEYAQKNKIPYLTDSSNKKTVYFRNKVRFQLMGIDEKSKSILYEYEKIRDLKIKLKIAYYKCLKKISPINTREIKTKEDVYCFLKASNISSNISLNKINLVFQHRNDLKNVKIDIDKFNELHICYGNFYILNKTKIKKKNSTQVLTKGENIFNELIFLNSDYDGILRTYKQGDIWKKQKGSKKVNRFFIDEKIPPNLRNIWPIVEENGQIIYIPQKSGIKLLKNIEEYNYE